MNERKPYWRGPGYRGEYSCPHGVGHGNHVHGCCGDHCCGRDDFPLNAANIEATRKKEKSFFEICDELDKILEEANKEIEDEQGRLDKISG